jgi:HK97 family phage major capsid protein
MADPILSADVIDQEAVREEIDGYARRNRVFRRAFRQIDSTDISNNTVQVPVLDEVRAAGVVDEGTAYPTAGDATRKVSVEHDKYGVEVEFSMESIEDGLLDVIAMHTEERAQDLSDALEDAAYSEVQDNLNSTVIGPDTPTGELAYDDVVDAMTQLETAQYDPDMLIVSAHSKGDLLKSDKFTRASELGDDVVRTGAFGQIAGMDVFVDNAGNLGEGEAIAFDTDRYGVESLRKDMTSMEYESEETNEVKIQVHNRMGWKAIRSEAGVKIEA